MAHKKARAKTVGTSRQAEVRPRQFTLDEIEATLAVSGPESYEPAKLDLAWRILSAAARGSKRVSARQRNRAIHLVSLGSGLEGVPRSRRPSQGRGTMLKALAGHLAACASYLRDLSAKEAKPTGRPRGHQAADPEATIAMRAMIRLIYDEIKSGKYPKAGRPLICQEAARRLAEQEKIVDQEERAYAVAIWAKSADTGTRDYKTWKPTSYEEVMISESVKRGRRLGVKLPSDTHPKG